MQVAEAAIASLRHGLDLEREDVEVFEHGMDACGYHAEVFGAGQHGGGAGELGQTAVCLFSPVAVMTLVEEVLVDAVVCLPVGLAEMAVGTGVLAPDVYVVYLCGLAGGDE